MKQLSLLGLAQRYGAPVLVAALAWILSACDSSKREASRTASPEAPPSEVVSLRGSEPEMIELPGRATGPTAEPLSEADQAWLSFVESTQTDDPPESWMQQEPTEAEMDAFRAKVAGQLRQSAEQAQAFYTRYPEHANAEEARRQEIGLLNFALQLGDTNGIERVEKLEAARLADPKISEDDKLQLRIQQLQRRMAVGAEADSATALARLEEGARNLRRDFPDRPEAESVLLFAAERWLDDREAGRAKTILSELATNAVAETIQHEAAEMLRKAERLNQPLALKFKALDGREIDLAQLNGKVVLIDFWASWCRPCMAELPRIKAAYEKLNPKGFEILGISFDRDRQTLDRTLAQEVIPWVQYLDEPEGEANLGERFGISSIPTMWLVNRQGVLVDLNARKDLEQKVEKLLAE